MSPVYVHEENHTCYPCLAPSACQCAVAGTRCGVLVLAFVCPLTSCALIVMFLALR